MRFDKDTKFKMEYKPKTESDYIIKVHENWPEQTQQMLFVYYACDHPKALAGTPVEDKITSINLCWILFLKLTRSYIKTKYALLPHHMLSQKKLQHQFAKPTIPWYMYKNSRKNKQEGTREGVFNITIPSCQCSCSTRSLHTFPVHPLTVFSLKRKKPI